MSANMSVSAYDDNDDDDDENESNETLSSAAFMLCVGSWKTFSYAHVRARAYLLAHKSFT